MRLAFTTSVFAVALRIKGCAAAYVGPYAYDVENRLTSLSKGAVAFVYNGEGIRVRKTVGSTNTLYLVDDRNPTGYAQVVEEFTTSGLTTNLAKTYVYGLALISQRQPGISTNFFLYDGHGSTRLFLDSTGGAAETYSYDAFGVLISGPASPNTEHLYSGEQRDPNLSFYYLRARYFNPEIGRFWTMDSEEGDLEEPKSLHVYNYAEGDPASNTDPSGRDIGEILTVMEIGFSIFSPVSPATSTAANRILNSDEWTVQTAMSSAMRLADKAVLNVRHWPNFDSTDYKLWFGKPSSDRKMTVRACYKAVLKDLKGKIPWERDDNSRYASTFAYTHPGTLKIWFCPLFWRAPLVGTDSKAGTIIHELTHVERVTVDHVYGTAGAKSLAVSDPDKAVHNADNYEYFAEGVK